MKYRYSLLRTEGTKKTGRQKIEGVTLILGRPIILYKKLQNLPDYVQEDLLPENESDLDGLKKGELLDIAKGRGFVKDELSGMKKSDLLRLLRFDLFSLEEEPIEEEVVGIEEDAVFGDDDA